MVQVWALVRSRRGASVILLLLLPISGGVASLLWVAIAGDWHVGANGVARVRGVLGGAITAAGAVLGGRLCDRIGPRLGYCLFGATLAVLAGLLAVAPRVPASFVSLALLYAFVYGGCFAAFSALVLDLIGHEGAATKFTLLACLSNLPIVLGVWLEGLVHDRFGSADMLLAEAALGLLSAAGFGILMLASHAVPRLRPA